MPSPDTAGFPEQEIFHAEVAFAGTHDTRTMGAKNIFSKLTIRPPMSLNRKAPASHGPGLG